MGTSTGVRPVLHSEGEGPLVRLVGALLLHTEQTEDGEEDHHQADEDCRAHHYRHDDVDSGTYSTTLFLVCGGGEGGWEEGEWRCVCVCGCEIVSVCVDMFGGVCGGVWVWVWDWECVKCVEKDSHQIKLRHTYNMCFTTM